jgi:phenylacetate-CoA ligase
LDRVEGRTDDLLFTRDGRRIGRLDPVFKSKLPIREAQIIQETLDKVRVRYVPTSEFNSQAASSMIERLQDRIGPVEVILEQVDEIPRTGNGKFRAVICNLSAEEKKLLNSTI